MSFKGWVGGGQHFALSECEREREMERERERQTDRQRETVRDREREDTTETKKQPKGHLRKE